MSTEIRWFALPTRVLTSGSWVDNCIRGFAGFLEKKSSQIEAFTEIMREKKTVFQSDVM
ncbi:uncharacterized protein METZ01_LOCUS105120 [marine metagenome]|uniref:Uncharacterized protein n=1 Tax=marine metagenome TaxID=408172 RepID=A0A381WIC5_9ZZZZ